MIPSEASPENESESDEGEDADDSSALVVLPQETGKEGQVVQYPAGPGLPVSPNGQSQRRCWIGTAPTNPNVAGFAESVPCHGTELSP